MAALTIERQVVKMGERVIPDLMFMPVAAATKIFAGAMVALNASGYLVPATSALGLTPVGRCEKTVDNTVGLALNGSLSVEVRQGAFKMHNSASTDLIAQANVGQDCFLVDDNTVALTSANNTRSRAGRIIQVDADGSVWVLLGLIGFQSPAPTSAFSQDLKLPIGFATANAAALYTVPAGQRLRVNRAYWEVVTPFTGGAASTIGVSSTDAAYNTKGDILGGAAGDAAATLIAGFIGGTLGTKFGSNGVVILVGGDVIRFDQITSAFTAGAGFVHVSVEAVLAA